MDLEMQQNAWKTMPLLLLLAAGSAIAAIMVGVNFNMESQVIASGGRASSTNFALSSSIGEGTAGDVVSSANFALKSGFIPTLHVPPPLPTVGLALNGAAFSLANPVMTLTATTVQSAPVTNADVYVALQLPNGALLIMQPNGSFSPAITPLLANVPIPDFSGVIFNHTFTGLEPTGNYTWFAALMQPGTMTTIGTLALAPFSFTP